ncbi:inovirus Gp2 family protein [Aeromonas hydrophila]|uniref:inovirus Gp2 family protein n=1 Tax=Aeromonas hydrophila TaxID=644 RepID=UPI001F61AA26|nr:inovirus Gp2 family protein [Aeromonas hydrophila]UNU29381.1 inovirus Gp2 family protein [Aeromonas hydrophila]
MLSQSSLNHNAYYLQRCQDTIDLALATHPRLMAVRIDLHFPNKELATDTKAITRFIDSLKAKLKANLQRKKKEDPDKRVHDTSLFYIWVREVGEQSERAHYHLVLMLNKDTFCSLGNYQASLTDNPRPSLSVMVRQAWCSALKLDDMENHVSLVHFPKNPWYWIRAQERNSVDYKGFLERVSYLAKDRTKIYNKEIRSFGCSAGGKKQTESLMPDGK